LNNIYYIASSKIPRFQERSIYSKYLEGLQSPLRSWWIRPWRIVMCWRR